MAKSQKKEDNLSMRKNININRILAVAIAAPIVAVILIAGFPVIWQGFVTVVTSIVPNFWVIPAYLYVALIAFLFGMKVGKKSNTKKDEK